MSEELLQYVWQHFLYDQGNLLSTCGQSLEIFNPGQKNTDAGPDFFNALIRIGATLWAGNVEVHLKSSDWYGHKHHLDAAYNNVILHVVLENDRDVVLPDGQALPVFIPRIRAEILDRYRLLVHEKTWPACHASLPNVDVVFTISTLDSVLVDRLKEKTMFLTDRLSKNKSNWNETFYQMLARNFGFHVNALPFDMLARSLPLSVLSRHKGSLFQIEALLFGQSGLLNEVLLGDDYFLALREEYSFLAKKYSLKGIECHVWKFLRLRPANFPTVRIAQFAALIHQSQGLLAKITEQNNVESLKAFFDLTASDYWDTHYQFNRSSGNLPKTMGEESKNNVLINTVVPFLYLFGERNNRQELKHLAIEL
ncbi:MAG TPA: DUF2851 family protein, partial [Prolixibacteraceae bacterium]|nr:DUF2851 family protein [Prolixibacteraceae bacterium]